MMRHAAAYWREQSKAGKEVKASIVNTSSTSGLHSNPGQINYGSRGSKVSDGVDYRDWLSQAPASDPRILGPLCGVTNKRTIEVSGLAAPFSTVELWWSDGVEASTQQLDVRRFRFGETREEAQLHELGLLRVLLGERIESLVQG